MKCIYISCLKTRSTLVAVSAWGSKVLWPSLSRERFLWSSVGQGSCSVHAGMCTQPHLSLVLWQQTSSKAGKGRPEVGGGRWDKVQRTYYNGAIHKEGQWCFQRVLGWGWGKNAKENGGGREKGNGEKGKGKAGRERAEGKALVMFTGNLRPSEIFKFKSSFSGTK